MAPIKREEWDWPPDGRRPFEERPRSTGWASPTATKIINGYLKVLFLLFKTVVGLVALAMIAFGALLIKSMLWPT